MLTDSSLKQVLFGGVLWSGAGKILSMGTNFIIMLVLARALTPSEYGTFIVAMTTIVVLAGVGTVGMDQVVVRFSAAHVGRKDYAGARNVLIRCLCIVLAAAIVSSVVFFWLGPPFFRNVLYMPQLAAYIVVLVGWLFFATVQRQLAETFRGLNDIRFATLFGGVRSSGIANGVIACALTLTLWVLGQLTIFTALISMLCTSVLVVLTAALVLWRYVGWRGRQGGGGATQVNQLAIGSALREGWLLWLAVLITTLNNAGSPWLASALDDPKHVALLGVAQRIVTLIVMPAVIINAVLPPVVSQLYVSSDIERLQRVVRSVGGLLLIPTLVLSAILVLQGRPMLRLMFGAYYENAYFILVVLCLGQVVSVATGAWQIVLPMTGARYQMLASSVVALLIQLVMGIGLGYLYGVSGVAVAYCTSTIITNAIGMLFVRRKLGIWTYASCDRRAVNDAVRMVALRIGSLAARSKSRA